MLTQILHVPSLICLRPFPSYGTHSKLTPDIVYDFTKQRLATIIITLLYWYEWPSLQVKKWHCFKKKKNHVSKCFIQDVVQLLPVLNPLIPCHLGFGGQLYLTGMVSFPWQFGCFLQKGNNKDHWLHSRTGNPGIRIIPCVEWRAPCLEKLQQHKTYKYSISFPLCSTVCN